MKFALGVPKYRISDQIDGHKSRVARGKRGTFLEFWTRRIVNRPMKQSSLLRTHEHIYRGPKHRSNPCRTSPRGRVDSPQLLSIFCHGPFHLQRLPIAPRHPPVSERGLWQSGRLERCPRVPPWQAQGRGGNGPATYRGGIEGDACQQVTCGPTG